MLSMDRARVAELHHSMRVIPVIANQVVNALSRIWKLAEDNDRLPDGRNPRRTIVKYRRRKRERFLSEEEFRWLDRVLDETENRKGISTHAIAAFRFLLLTRCRRSEILTLKWNEVDLKARELNLSDSKISSQSVPLSLETVEVLAGIPRIDGSQYLISGQISGKPMSDFWVPRKIICKCAVIRGMRIHDCRHSFASMTLALGENLLVRPGSFSTTVRWRRRRAMRNLAQDSLRAAAVRVSDSIVTDLFRRYRLVEDFRNGTTGQFRLTD